jgi:hypothetical protein
MRRMEARRRKASALQLRFSQSLASACHHLLRAARRGHALDGTRRREAARLRWRKLLCRAVGSNLTYATRIRASFEPSAATCGREVRAHCPHFSSRSPFRFRAASPPTSSYWSFAFQAGMPASATFPGQRVRLPARHRTSLRVTTMRGCCGKGREAAIPVGAETLIAVRR